MLQELTDKDFDISFAKGFVETWAQDAPKQVKDCIETIVTGVKYYRDKFVEAQEDYIKLQNDYNRLTAQTALYLHTIQTQKEQVDQLLIDSQRDLHKTE